MKDFDLRKYLAEGRLLKEDIDFPELEDEFEGAMDAMIVEPEVYLQDIIDASAEEIVSDDYYEIMNAVEQGVYSAEEAVKLAKAWAKDKLSSLAENKLLKEEVKVGDTIGNTVQGFDFEVIGIEGDKYHVKHKRSGKEFKTDKDNMYKGSPRLKEEIDINKILSDGGYDIIDDEELLMTVKSRLKGKSNIDAEKLNLLVMKIEDEEGGNIDFT